MWQRQQKKKTAHRENESATPSFEQNSATFQHPTYTRLSTLINMRRLSRMVKMASSKAEARGTGGVPSGYVEDSAEPRTKLEAGFHKPLAEQGHHAQTHQQIVDRMGENAGQEASGLFIGPSPEHSAPTHTTVIPLIHSHGRRRKCPR